VGLNLLRAKIAPEFEPASIKYGSGSGCYKVDVLSAVCFGEKSLLPILNVLRQGLASRHTGLVQHAPFSKSLSHCRRHRLDKSRQLWR
jgi:hypothetical protein